MKILSDKKLSTKGFLQANSKFLALTTHYLCEGGGGKSVEETRGATLSWGGREGTREEGGEGGGGVMQGGGGGGGGGEEEVDLVKCLVFCGELCLPVLRCREMCLCGVECG